MRISDWSSDVCSSDLGDDIVPITYDDGMRSYTVKRPFEGVLPNLERRWRETESDMIREDLSRYQSQTACEACGGYRLKPEALAVKVGARHIGEVCELSILEARQWFLDLTRKLKPKEKDIAARILKEINDRLGFLVNVGLDYLSMSRSSGTLSGGESQRIRLRSEEHTSELQSLMRISYDVF